MAERVWLKFNYSTTSPLCVPALPPSNPAHTSTTQRIQDVTRLSDKVWHDLARSGDRAPPARAWCTHSWAFFFNWLLIGSPTHRSYSKKNLLSRCRNSSPCSCVLDCLNSFLGTSLALI